MKKFLLILAAVAAVQPYALAEEHEAVDLGLSVKFASSIMKSPETTSAFSTYFWGDNVPKTDMYQSPIYSNMDIGKDISGTKFDTAMRIWGPEWRMPTQQELEELATLTWESATVDDIPGWNVSGNGNTIFIPRMGQSSGQNYIKLWSSTQDYSPYSWPQYGAKALYVLGSQTPVIKREGVDMNAYCILPVLNERSGQSVTSMSCNSSHIIEVGQSAELIVRVDPADAANKNLIYTVENPEVVSVSEYGCATALATGVTKIKVTPADGSNMSCNITITVPGDPVSFEGSDPAGGSCLESLDDVKVYFAPFTLGDQTYAPTFASYSGGYNVIKLYRGEESQPVEEIEVWIDSEDGKYFIKNSEPINHTMYEGYEYRLVIPAGMFKTTNSQLGNLVANNEFTIYYTGSTSTKSDLGLSAACAERNYSHADIVSFVTLKYVKAADDAMMLLNDGEETVAKARVLVADESDKSRVYSDFGGFALEAGKSYTVILPDGAVTDMMGLQSNTENSVVLSGLPAAKEVEFAANTLHIGNIAAVTFSTPADVDSKVQILPSEDWTLESMKLGDEDVTENVDEEGNYVIAAHSAPVDIDAVLAYAGKVDFDFESGVETIEGCDYAVKSENGRLVISNVAHGAVVKVYSMEGMLLASETASLDVCSIALAEGIYIVAIDNVTLKVRHTL